MYRWNSILTWKILNVKSSVILEESWKSCWMVTGFRSAAGALADGWRWKWKLIARHFKLVSREGFFFLSAHLEVFTVVYWHHHEFQDVWSDLFSGHALSFSERILKSVSSRALVIRDFIHRESVKILMNHEWFYQICALSLLFKPWNDHREQIHWCACFVCRMVWTVWAILNANEAWNPAWIIVLQSSSFPGRVKKRETGRDRPNMSCSVETCLGAPCFALVLPLPCLPQRFCASCRLPSFSQSDQTGDTMSACRRTSLWTWRRWCLVWQLATRTSRRCFGSPSDRDGEGDGSQGDGEGEQCGGQIQTFAIQIFVREFQVLVGTAFLRLPQVCPEQILVESRAKYGKNKQGFGRFGNNLLPTRAYLWSRLCMSPFHLYQMLSSLAHLVNTCISHLGLLCLT